MSPREKLREAIDAYLFEFANAGNYDHKTFLVFVQTYIDERKVLQQCLTCNSGTRNAVCRKCKARHKYG